MVFTAAERAYLETQPIGRIATSNPDGEPDVAPVGFRLDGDVVEIGGFDITKTIKYHNVKATGRAAFVVDDLASLDPWQPRGLKLRGRAEVGRDGSGKATIRLSVEKIWSWGLNEKLERPSLDVVERRSVV